MQLIHCYKHKLVSSRKGYFSTKIESGWKYAVFVFEIPSKRQKILCYGVCFSDIENIFLFALWS